MHFAFNKLKNNKHSKTIDQNAHIVAFSYWKLKIRQMFLKVAAREEMKMRRDPIKEKKNQCCSEIIFQM